MNENVPIPGESTDGTPLTGRSTAVVIVHGMGEQEPVQTLKGFVRTALKPIGEDGMRKYYSRPALLTNSFEARRYIAFPIPRANGEVVREQAELYEYHWSYLMTGNKFADVIPTVLRLLRQPFGLVPRGLRWFWMVVWTSAAILIVANVVGVVHSGASVTWLLNALAGNAIALGAVILAMAVLHVLGVKITAYLVDVIRYLDTSPRSYQARRAIRGGLVDMLRELHRDGRYSRVIVVAHSLGGFIAYDALGSLWTELHTQHAEPSGDGTSLGGLQELEELADRVLAAGFSSSFQDAQFNLWCGLRRQGNPWLVTDLVTLGTPMYFADLLFTRNREEFDEMIEDGELWRCPPRSEKQLADDPTPPSRVHYGWTTACGVKVLGSWSMFAAVRWTNMWFPAEWGFFGDWFGGPLHSLFGNGVKDVKIKGNFPGRLFPGMAHTRYFSYPDEHESNDVATYVRGALKLDDPSQLVEGPRMATADGSEAASLLGAESSQQF